MNWIRKNGREKFKKNKKVITFFVKIFRMLPESLTRFIWDCITNHSQTIFVGMRYIILKSFIKECGDNVSIGANVQIIGWKNLSIGSNVSIHANCYIDATGEIIIGDNVSIAHNSTILSTNHDWIEEDIPIKYNSVKFGKVCIADDVWVGCGCRILAGIKIENRSIIAAGAVVTKDVKSRNIVGGIPARLIKEI